MSATTILLAGVALGAGCAEASDADAAEAAAGLACEEPAVDFGEVREGTVLRHRFELTAVRDGLRVDAVRADCGCTVASLEAETPAGGREVYEEARPLAAGARVWVDVAYDTRGKRGDAPRSISLHTGTGRLELVLRARVEPWLEVTPTRLDVPLVSVHDELRRTLRVESTDGAPFRLRPSGRGVPPQIRLEPRPLGEAGGGALAAAWEVEVRLGPDLPPGLHGYALELVAEPAEGSGWSPGEDGTLTVAPMLTVRVVDRVSLDPTSLSFGRVGPNETVARTVRLTSHDAAFTLPRPEARVVPVRPDADAALPEVARVTASPVPGANAWDLQVLLEGLGGRFEGTFLGRLVVTTGHPDQPEVEATLNGFLAPEAAAPAR